MKGFLRSGLGAGFAEGFEETAAIEVIMDDGFTAVAAVHDVVDRAQVFKADFAGHAAKLLMAPIRSIFQL